MHDRAIIHGCLVAIDRVGILIVGDAGVGKTTVCLELAGNGHSFIADDAVEIRRRISELVGSAPNETSGAVAIRGVEGLSPIPTAGELSTSIHLVIELTRSLEKSMPYPSVELLRSIPIRRVVVGDSIAEEIESLAHEMGRGHLQGAYGKQTKT